MIFENQEQDRGEFKAGGIAHLLWDFWDWAVLFLLIALVLMSGTTLVLLLRVLSST